MYLAASLDGDSERTVYGERALRPTNRDGPCRLTDCETRMTIEPWNVLARLVLFPG
jgi:hypothetical protein